MNNADLIEQIALEQARRSFWAYRQYINPKMIKGWFPRHLSHRLQKFWEDYCAGLRPMLVVESPPQHGKSDAVAEFISWIIGHNPELRTIFASFSARLSVRTNTKIQRIMESRKYNLVFPDRFIDPEDIKVVRSKRQRNKSLIEFYGASGYFRNTTVSGAISGESLDIGVIDDPIKGRKAANSITVRNTAWDWLMDDFMTRFADDSAFLCVLTRWHPDDPIGRLKEVMPQLECVRYPALSAADAVLMPEDPRPHGSDLPLFPELKSKEFLLIRKNAMVNAYWQALYQQNPVTIGGNIIKGAAFKRFETMPKIEYRKIFADTAQKTKEANDYSVLECWGKTDDNRAMLIDLARGKWEAPELERRTVAFWNKHAAIQGLGVLRELCIEDKASGTGLIQKIRLDNKIPVKAIPRSTDKLTRVMDAVPYIDAGMVGFLAGAPFENDFIAECEAFSPDDSHQHDDQIDPMCDAIMDLIGTRPKGFFDF